METDQELMDDKDYAKNHGLETPEELYKLSKPQLIRLINNLRIDVHNERTNQRIVCKICQPYYRTMSELYPDIKAVTSQFGIDQGFGGTKAIGVISSNEDLLCASVEFEKISGEIHWRLEKGIPFIEKWEDDSAIRIREIAEWKEFVTLNPEYKDTGLRPKFDDE
jgi:hypothetical protein